MKLRIFSFFTEEKFHEKQYILGHCKGCRAVVGYTDGPVIGYISGILQQGSGGNIAGNDYCRKQYNYHNDNRQHYDYKHNNALADNNRATAT